MARRSLLSHFADLPDPWVERTKKHTLDEVLLIALAGTVCEARTFEELGDFAEAYEDWFRASLGLELKNGVPSHDTIYRVLCSLDRKGGCRGVHPVGGGVGRDVRGHAGRDRRQVAPRG